MLSPPRVTSPLALGRRTLAVALALGGPGLVTLLALTSVHEPTPALLYLVAISATAVVGGVWWALAAGLASVLLLDYFFMEPVHEFALHASEAIAAAVFALVAVVISELIGRQRRARAAAEEARGAAERLERATMLLAESLSPQQVLDAVLTEGVRAAEARAGLIALVDGDELEVVAYRGYHEHVIDPWQRFPLDGPYPLSQAVREQEPVFLRSREERDERFPAMAELRENGHALACLPLVVDGRSIGGLTFSFERDRDFHQHRRELKMALARQAAIALERTRLYQAERTLRERASFLGEAAALLASSLNYEATLAQLAELAVPRLADWCAVDMVGEDGSIERLAVVHTEPAKVAYAHELAERYPPDPEAKSGVPHVLRTQEPEFHPTIPDEVLVAAARGDEELLRIARELGLSSSICVPIVARGRSLGALTLVQAESGRHYTADDLELARELAGRAAAAVDNALLYREAERRGDAALALAYVGDGVVLLDRADVIRHWNPAAARITGIEAEAAMGCPVTEVLPAWPELVAHVELGRGEHAELGQPASVPLPLDETERWISISGVRFSEGTVYALRDVTAEHALEQTRSDFVATASHELRTPLAAVYGAVKTLRSGIAEDRKDEFLAMIESEAERLSEIVAQILVAGQLDAGTLSFASGPCDSITVAESVVASARLRAPAAIELELEADEGLPPVAADADKLRQVLANLVENAIKYSPEGGPVRVVLSATDGHGRIEVSDRGLGIPLDAQTHVFEKFFRVDAALLRGIGGSGLGLFISRELVERMDGRLTLRSRLGEGSTFTVELPLA